MESERLRIGVKRLAYNATMRQARYKKNITQKGLSEESTLEEVWISTDRKKTLLKYLKKIPEREQKVLEFLKIYKQKLKELNINL